MTVQEIQAVALYWASLPIEQHNNFRELIMASRNWTPQQLRDYEARMYGKTKCAPPPSDSSEDESELQESIVSECRRRGWFCVRSRMDRATTNGVGTPDIIIAADNGRVIWVEAKSKTGKLRPEQIAVKVWLEKLGQKYLLVRSLSEFVEGVK